MGRQPATNVSASNRGGYNGLAGGRLPTGVAANIENMARGYNKEDVYNR